ncbi:TonB-dependent receptor [Sphingobium sp. SCG-1]|uniref:TonB-dependent receptor domain-containing protein n=1 Tax=Sphingobium sp. SCG-1 TaxID=2072936 RepID=UPI000CD6B38D|nr:TonB-dependent receptor [Sphingobium sp. SCG-1]AUW59521.1 TonB-dependent receptor [Sphingobium sp. SCG-1]
MNTFSKRALLRTSAAPAILGASLMATVAFAQDVPQASDAADTGDAIVVTGSLIRDPNLIRSSPVIGVTSKEVELRQSNVAEEFLRSIPGIVADQGSAVNNGQTGASFVNLRGLGSNRNLVLLDGTRIVPADLTGAVDLNNIPLALIERTDVLTGGATTTYGADAVSGVVNFITKRDFAGVNATVSNQITEQGDGYTLRADLTIGANFDDGRGNAVFSIGYQKAKPVYQGDRSFSRFAIDQTSGAQGGSATTVPSYFFAPVVGQINPATGLVDEDYFAPYNYNPVNLYQTPFQRYNMYGAAHYEVSDAVEVYAQGLFSKNKVSTVSASSGTFFNDYDIPVSNPFLTDALRTQFCDAGGISAAECAAAATITDPNNPAYRTFGASIGRRFVEAGPRLSEYTTTMFNYRMGATGGLISNLAWDVYGSYGESENIQRQSGNGLNSRVKQALQAVDASTCVDPTGGCVPLNLFGNNGSITPDMIRFLDVSVSSSVKTSLGQVHGQISGDFGLVSPLASRPINIAIAGEYRKYKASTSSDLASQTPSEVLGNGAATPDSTGAYDVHEFFAEIVAPLIENRPFIQSLTFEGGVRQSDYSTTGSNFTWKTGGSWAPISSLRFRGNYQKAVRAPNISELYQPLVVGLDNLANDPCAGTAPTLNANLGAICLAQGAPSIGSIPQPSAGQPNVSTGGNLDLDVEKATTYTIGGVFEPVFARGLNISVDYYNIKVVNAITTPTVGDVIGACFNNITAASAQSPACLAIQRNPNTGALSGDAASTPGIGLPLSNLGELMTDGIDLTVNYDRDIGFANLGLNFSGNWTSRSKFKATPSSVNRDCVGYYSVNCASIQPEFQWNFRSTLSFEKFDISVLWRHLSSQKYEPLQLADDLAHDADPVLVDADGTVAPLDEYRRIKAMDYFDLTARFAPTDVITITASVMNVFDKKPPIVGATIGSTSYNNGNTYPSTYDALGRRFAVTAGLRF